MADWTNDPRDEVRIDVTKTVGAGGTKVEPRARSPTPDSSSSDGGEKAEGAASKDMKVDAEEKDKGVPMETGEYNLWENCNPGGGVIDLLRPNPGLTEIAFNSLMP